MANYGIKATVPGFNVGTNTDPTQLVVSTDYDSLKLALKGTISIATAGTTGIGVGTVTHNLGYAPSYRIFGKRDSDKNYWFPSYHFPGEYLGWENDTDLSANSHVGWYHEITPTNLKITYINSGTSGTTDFAYFIYYDTGA